MANQAEMDDEAYTDTFPFDVHFCVSRGRCAYTFEEVKPSEGGFAITISQENSNKFASATFTEAQVSEFQKYFEEEAGPQELEGNCFCTIESQPEHALEELKFLADKGKGRKPPSRDEVTERICQAFAKLEEPNFKQDMTGGDEWRYFVSLFDLSVFEDDPVSKAWVAQVSSRVNEISEGKVSVSSVPLGEFPEDRGVNSVRDIRLKVSDGSSTLWVEILPASNGWWTKKQ